MILYIQCIIIVLTKQIRKEVVKMEKFIRIDRVGEWRGTEHVSSMQGLGDEIYFEDGISCYAIDDIQHALESLYRYWKDTVGNRSASDFEGFQVTIFEGEYVGTGTEMEDLAECHRTLYELDAVAIMGALYDVMDDMYYEEITEEEYVTQLANLIAA